MTGVGGREDSFAAAADWYGSQDYGLARGGALVRGALAGGGVLAYGGGAARWEKQRRLRRRRRRRPATGLPDRRSDLRSPRRGVGEGGLARFSGEVADYAILASKLEAGEKWRRSDALLHPDRLRRYGAVGQVFVSDRGKEGRASAVTVKTASLAEGEIEYGRVSELVVADDAEADVRWDGGQAGFHGPEARLRACHGVRERFQGVSEVKRNGYYGRLDREPDEAQLG